MMITTTGSTVDRRNRDSELNALAGRHTAVLQRWRELEDVSVSSSSSRRERRNLGSSRGEEEEEEEEEEADEVDFSGWSGQREEEAMERRSLSREESPDLGVRRQIVRGLIDTGSPASSQRNDSPRGAEWLDETERERVRLVREWMHLASQQRDGSSGRREERERERDRDLDLSSRDGSVTDHEDGLLEHVRREQLRLRGRQARLELIRRIVGERQRELQGLSDNRAVSEFAHRGRLQSLLRGRFLRNGSPTEEERPPSVAARELGHLRQRRRVSGLREGFRFRLENIVRGQVSNHPDSFASHDANSSDNIQSQLSTEGDLPNQNYEQSRSSNEDIGIPEVPESQTEEPGRNNMEIMGWPESTGQEGNWQEDEQHGMREWQQGTENAFSELHEENGEESVVNWQENNQGWSEESPGIDVEEDSEDWNEDSSNVTAENWQDEHSGPLRNDRHLPMGRINRFILPDDESVYSMELRELVSRRSVSNLLRSGFRESLDQLIQSYVQRQGRSPIDWDIQGSLQNTSMPMGDPHQQGDNANIDQQDSVAQIPVVPLPPIPPQPNLRQERHHHWTRYRMLRPEIENDVISDLRTEMARLQQGMNHIQRMLEACMDMQLELQRSVRQEVSAALNRSSDEQGVDAEESEDGSKWNHVRKGICCVCCDNHIDSLLYRCGHMCTCLKCANELLEGGDKCPLCRAPIVEVIRAYSIL